MKEESGAAADCLMDRNQQKWNIALDFSTLLVFVFVLSFCEILFTLCLHS